MSGSGFDVRYVEVQRLYADCEAYRNDVCPSLEKIDTSMQGVVGLETFQGASAESIKAYFQEVHQPLVMNLSALMEQLLTDYGKEYYPQFKKSPISETHANIARWPEDGMKKAEKALDELLSGDLHDAVESLKTAEGCFPSGSSFAIPRATGLSDDIREQIDRTKKVREAVEQAEEKGYSLLSNESGEFENLANALRAAIAACANGKVSLAGYTAGAFSSIVASSGLKSAYNACIVDQNENREIVVKSRQDCLNKEAARIKRAEEKALEEKKKACWWGTIASIAVVIGGAMAFVATAGTATPVLFALHATLFGANLVKTATDMTDRVTQLVHVHIDDPLANKNDHENKSADKAVKYAKAYEKVGALDHHYRSGNTGKALEDLDDLGDWGRDQVFDKASEKLKDAIGGEGGAWVDAACKAGKEGLDQIIDHKFSGAGIVSAAGEGVEAVADYYVEQADNRLEELNDRSEKIDEAQENLKSGKTHAWGGVW